MSVWQPLNVRWLGLSAVIVVLDQFSKWMLSYLLAPYTVVKILPFLNIMLAYNRGTAYSLFSTAPEWSRWALSGVAILISCYLLILLMKTEQYCKWTLSSYALILGGALGNLIDRLSHGYVIDFIDFHIGDWHFATFNIADSAITVGAILLAAILLLKRE